MVFCRNVIAEVRLETRQFGVDHRSVFAVCGDRHGGVAEDPIQHRRIVHQRVPRRPHACGLVRPRLGRIARHCAGGRVHELTARREGSGASMFRRFECSGPSISSVSDLEVAPRRPRRWLVIRKQPAAPEPARQPDHRGDPRQQDQRAESDERPGHAINSAVWALKRRDGPVGMT